MAYENYSQVSWTDGTPITGERLQQMSTNIEQVKEATGGAANAIKRLKTVVTSSAQNNTFTTTTEIIALKDESSTSGPDNRVSVLGSRFYRVVLNFTGFQIDAKGAEDSFYQVSIHDGIHGSANTMIHSADFTPQIFAFINTASLGGAATIANITLRSDSFDTRFGSGTYAVVLQSGAGFSNKSFFAAVTRFQGQSQNNAPAFIVPASSSKPLQLYVEDGGGVA